MVLVKTEKGFGDDFRFEQGAEKFGKELSSGKDIDDRIMRKVDFKNVVCEKSVHPGKLIQSDCRHPVKGKFQIVGAEFCKRKFGALHEVETHLGRGNLVGVGKAGKEAFYQRNQGCIAGTNPLGNDDGRVKKTVKEWKEAQNFSLARTGKEQHVVLLSRSITAF